MEYSLIKKVVEELNEGVLPARIAKIYQPDAHVIIFKVWNGRTTFRLLLSAEPGKSRLHLTDREFINPARPPRFCQLLRSRVTHIDSIALKNDDRVVSIRCKGEAGSVFLIAELTGKHPNLILTTEDQTIIDALNRVEPGCGGGRKVRAGLPYLFPESGAMANVSDQQLDEPIDGDFPYNEYAESRGVGRSEERQDLHQRLIKLVKKQKQKIGKRLSRIEDDLALQENSEEYKIRGELLLANLHQLKRGMATVAVDNYYCDPPQTITIELDPVLDGQANAQRYFKIFKKYRRGVDHNLRRLEESEAELRWLNGLDYQLHDAVNKSDIEDISEELRHIGLLKDAGSLNARRTTISSEPRETTSPSGLMIIWGRNNRQNDQVTTRMAKEGDLWFHAHKIPGSHVVLKTAGGQAQEEDILFAAGIAAGYSKAKTDNKVEVIEARVRNVEKKKGNLPGQVFVKDYKVRLVAPLRIE